MQGVVLGTGYLQLQAQHDPTRDNAARRWLINIQLYQPLFLLRYPGVPTGLKKTLVKNIFPTRQWGVGYIVIINSVIAFVI